MRLAWPLPWHLIASVLISFIVLALVHLSPLSLQGTLSLLALIFVFLIPGYLATLSLFPGKSDLSGKGRAFLCLISSAILAGLFSFILMATPRGLQSASLATILSLLAIFLAAVAYGRWSNLPRKRRFLLLPKRGLGFARAFPRSALAILLLGGSLVAALALAFGPYQFPFDEPFTKLEVASPGEAAGPLSSSGELSSPSPSNKEERLWVNLSQNISAKSDVTNSSVIANDKSNVTVLSTGGGGNGGSMGGGSSSGSSSQAAAKKPASQKVLQPVKTESSSPTATSTAVGKLQSNNSVAGKNVSSSSPKSSKENLTDKDNTSLNNNLTFDRVGMNEKKKAAATENLTSVQGLPAPVRTPSPQANLSSKLVESSSPAVPKVNGSADNKTGKIPAKIAPPQNVSYNESDLSRVIQSEIKSNTSQVQGNANSNSLPVLKTLVPDRSSPQQQGAAIFWKAEATDVEGDKILYRFFLNGQEVRKWSKTNSWSWLSQDLPAGDYQITVLVIDGKHASLDSFDGIINASFTLSRTNQAPVLQELKPDPLSPQSKGGMITWTASAIDPDNDKIYYKFMKNDEGVSDWSTSNSWVWDTSSEKQGDYRIAVLAKDGLHASKASFDSSLDSSFALTSLNRIPEVTALKADRASPQAIGSVITWNAIAVDPDGDEIFYKFLANDKEVREWSSSNSWVWNTSSVTPGEHKIKVLAIDGKHAPKDSFDSFKDAVITITDVDSNQPPVLKALVPDIASPQVQGATVIWNAEAQDPEGDKILYKFQLNGRDMGRWSETASWKWSSRDLVPGDYKIRVLARDGKHASEASFDSSMDAVFSLISEIDQQIDQLMKKRPAEASNLVLGKSNSTVGQEQTIKPRKLGG